MTKISDLVAASVVDPADIRFGVDQTDLSETRQLSLDALQKAGQLRVVDSIVQLLLVTNPRDGQLFQTKGYTTPGDGGGNLYRYDVASAATVDGGWVINGPSSVGRYLAIDRTVANVLQFGAFGNSVVDDTAAIQAAIDAAEATIGGVVVFPAVAGGYRCNVTVDATKGLTLRGEGNKAMLWSQAAGGWAMKIEGENYPGQTSIVNLYFFGNGKAADGVYINAHTNVAIRDCLFSGCGIGLCSNATIKNQVENCVFTQNYVGLFLTSATGANTTISDIAGRTVNLTNRLNATQPGAQFITNFQFNQNNCAVYIEQPDLVASARLNGSQFIAGAMEGNDIGIWVRQGSVQQSQPVVTRGVWFEANDGPAVTIDGHTSASAADMEMVDERVLSVGDKLDRIVLSGNTIANFIAPTFISSSVLTLNDTASAIADDVVGEHASLWDLFANTVRQAETGTNRASAIQTTHKTKLSRGYDDNILYSRTLLPGSLMTAHGSDTRSTVADGLFEQQACMEVSPATINHGVRTDGITTVQNQIGLFTFGIKGIFAAPTAVAVDSGTDTFTATAHGFGNNGKVIFATNDTLPVPLVAGTEYWLVNATTNTFQVSLTRGGTALDITSTGIGAHTVEQVVFELETANMGAGSFVTQRPFPVRSTWRTYAIVGLAAAGGEGDLVIRTPVANQTWRMSGFQALTFGTMAEVAEFQRSSCFAMDPSETLYSSGAGSPSGVLTPTFVGQDYLDTTGSAWYRSTGTTNTDWQAL